MDRPIAYLITLVAFVALDPTWRRLMGAKLCRQTLGDILLTDLRIAPAAAFSPKTHHHKDAPRGARL